MMFIIMMLIFLMKPKVKTKNVLLFFLCVSIIINKKESDIMKKYVQYINLIVILVLIFLLSIHLFNDETLLDIENGYDNFKLNQRQRYDNRDVIVKENSPSKDVGSKNTEDDDSIKNKQNSSTQENTSKEDHQENFVLEVEK